MSAIQLYQSLSGPYVTTDYVLVETADGLASRRLRHLVEPIMRELEAEPTITRLPASPRLLDAGFRVFYSRLDKELEPD